MYMSKTTDKTAIILPKINRALAAAGQPPAEVVRNGGRTCLRFPTGDRRKIRQLGAFTAAMLPLLGKDAEPGKSILWCRFVGEPLAEELARRKICYADTAGNMFLLFGGNFLQIRNCPKPKELKDDLARGRCLTPAGLKVMFLLLTEPDAVCWNYRKIAAFSGTTIGTVNCVMSDLRGKRHLLEDDAGRRLTNLPTLGRLWVDHYRLRLLPKLKTARYSGELRKIDPGDALAAGGETAAGMAKLLNSGNILLWDQKPGYARTAARNRWHLDDGGNIEIREAFWPVEKRRFGDHVPWLLVYADLLATEDGRCIEAADEIRSRYLEGLA